MTLRMVQEVTEIFVKYKTKYAAVERRQALADTIEYLAVSNHANIVHETIVLTESSKYKLYTEYLLVYTTSM